MLCLALNGALRDSARPWGFIPTDAIHNLISLKEERRRSINASDMSEMGPAGQRVGLTFRRLDNLRVWVASLKLRYGVRGLLLLPYALG